MDRTFQQTVPSGLLPETLYTNAIANGLKFLLVAHMVTSDARFDSYGFLKTEHGVELIWID
jgi:hypothetical protein